MVTTEFAGKKKYNINQYESGAGGNDYLNNIKYYGINRNTTREEDNSIAPFIEHDEHHGITATWAKGSIFTDETEEKVNKMALSGTEDINNRNLTLGNLQTGNTQEREGNGHTSKVKKTIGHHSNTPGTKYNGNTQNIKHRKSTARYQRFSIVVASPSPKTIQLIGTNLRNRMEVTWA